MQDYYAVTLAGHDICIKHYGVKGMKKGVRRYQNADGTLTAEGRQKYGFKDPNFYSETRRGVNNAFTNAWDAKSERYKPKATGKLAVINGVEARDEKKKTMNDKPTSGRKQNITGSTAGVINHPTTGRKQNITGNVGGVNDKSKENESGVAKKATEIMNKPTKPNLSGYKQGVGNAVISGKSGEVKALAKVVPKKGKVEDKIENESSVLKKAREIMNKPAKANLSGYKQGVGNAVREGVNSYNEALLKRKKQLKGYK